MSKWILILFFLGLVCTVVGLIGNFEWLMPWWSAILMIAALRMLTHIWKREEDGERENLVGKIQYLEDQLRFK
jgi:hypothetical protein